MNTRIDLAEPAAIRDRKARTKINMIVIHVMEGTLAGSVAWFKTPGRPVPTAAHYLVGADGSIVQMVPDEKKCFHAGNDDVNNRSIGIELEGYTAKSAGFGDAMLASAAKVTAILCAKYGIPLDRAHVVGHSEVPRATHTDPGPGFAWDRFMALVRGYGLSA